jgi:hypothetical protein
MRLELQQAYAKGCADCQWNKSSTMHPSSPLHPLSIPDQYGDSVAMDFIGPLPPDSKNNTIVTFTDQLGSNIYLAATSSSIKAEDLALIFFNKWYCKNGLPLVSSQNRWLK